MKKTKVILASDSPSRKQLLQSLGLPFQVMSHKVDEIQFQKKIKDPYILCPLLAKKKIQSIQKKNVWVIGADQMVYCKKKIFGKPKTKAKALQTLSFLQGKNHELVSALCLQKPDGSFFEDTVVNKMKMRPLTKKQIEYYLNQDQPYHCAGSYRIEGAGISLFEQVETRDFYSIMGLAIISLCSQLPLQLFLKPKNE